MKPMKNNVFVRKRFSHKHVVFHWFYKHIQKSVDLRTAKLEEQVVLLPWCGDSPEVLQILEPLTLNAMCTHLEFPWVYSHSGSLQTQWEYLIPDFPEDQ